jgi:hypothetical protein
METVYRYADKKFRNKPNLSTLKMTDNTYTTDTISTVDRIMDQFVPEDNEGSDEAQDKQVVMEYNRSAFLKLFSSGYHFY